MKKIQLSKCLRTRQAKWRTYVDQKIKTSYSFFNGERAYIANNESSKPRTAVEAGASPQTKEWESAMKSERKSLMQNEVWDLVELPSGRSAVGYK